MPKPKQLPDYFLPLVSSVNVNQKVTSLAVLESYELFIDSLKKRGFSTTSDVVDRRKVTAEEEFLLTKIREKQVVVPEKLFHGDPASDIVADLYMRVVGSSWVGFSQFKVTSQMKELLGRKPLVSFNKPRLNGAEVPSNTGLMLGYFKRSRMGSSKSFIQKAGIALTRQEGSTVNVSSAFYWATRQPEYFSVTKVLSFRFWFKEYWGFSVALVGLLFAPFIFTLILSGSILVSLSLLPVFFVGFTFVSVLLLFAGLMAEIITDGDIDFLSFFTNFEVVSTTKAGLQLAEEIAPWDRYMLRTSEPVAYLSS